MAWFKRDKGVSVKVFDTSGKEIELRAYPRYLLIISEGEEPVHRSWWNYTRALWNGEDHLLSFTPTDPAEKPLVYKTGEADLSNFMDVVLEGINWSLIHVENHMLANGTQIHVWILRDEDAQPFSVVTATGDLGDLDKNGLLAMENQARDAAGMTPLRQESEAEPSA